MAEGAGEAKPALLWECYGPPHEGALGADGQVALHGLQARPELNGLAATLLGWEGCKGRFIVDVRSPSRPCSERILVRAANLQGRSAAAATWSTWASSEPQLGALSADVAPVVARALGAGGVAALSAACRAVRAALCLQPEAKALWEALLVPCFGRCASEVVQRARPGVTGQALFRAAAALRERFGQCFEVVQGSVAAKAGRAEVVACPCLRDLHNPGYGAQGAVRRAAGADLEEAIARIGGPLEELSVVLVPGGKLAKKVAMTVTEPPYSLMMQLFGLARDGRIVPPQDEVDPFDRFLLNLHRKLLRTVREAGHRFLAMPSLCTGGMGVPAHLVAVAAVAACYKDFIQHPADPIHVRLCCFEPDQVSIFEHQRAEAMSKFLTCPNIEAKPVCLRHV